jgi:outer membrane protein TolC
VLSDRATSNRAAEQQSARVGLTLTQALLRGRGPGVNLARVEQARLDTVASRYELQAFVETLIAETERAYWRYALGQQETRIFEESLGVARLQQQEVEDRIRIGVLASTERASAEAEVAQREQALIDVRARTDVLRLRLLRLTNPDRDGRLTALIAITSDPRTELLPVEDLEDRITLAVRSRPELNESRARLAGARLETVVTRNGLLPRLDFFLTLGKSGYSDSFGRAFQDLDGDSFDIAAGLELSASLGNRTARAFDRAANTSRRQAAEAVENLEQLVEVDVRIAAAEVERARQQITASTVTRALREEALRAENERFRVGSSTTLLVAQAQRDLLESQIAEVEALTAYRLALIDLYVAEGTLTQRRGLNLGE